MRSPENEIRAARTLVRREVLRQVLAPDRVVISRLVLYYLTKRLDFQRPWMSAKNALYRLANEERIVSEDIDGTKWYRLPRVSRAKLDAALETKPPLYDAWTHALQASGSHAEDLWRQAFRDEGWVVPIGNPRLLCPLPDDPEGAHSSEHELDVWATYPARGYTVACEVKNRANEGWIDPDVVSEARRNRSMASIRHHFRSMAAIGLTPMLAAPFVDPSFYAFQATYQGVHARYLYHVFAPEYAATAERVKAEFRIGHVWASEGPPPNFRKFVRRLPPLLDRLHEKQDS